MPLVASSLMLASCHRVPHQAPPRSTDNITVPPQTSTISVPVQASLVELGQALNQAIPRTLWTIDKPGQTCVASKKVKVLFARIKTPKLKCRIVGVVTRGAVTLSGAGRDMVITMPLHATIRAQDIGGILKRETAEADARVRAAVRLDIAPDWSPRGKVAIHYDWIDTPHLQFLGQRIEFTSKADAKLKRVIATLEQTLPRELAKLHFREQVARAWASAFTSISLNEANPPVWMRITPQELSYGGYQVAGGTVTLSLGMKALTETFVGSRPVDPRPVPLPRLSRTERTPQRILFAIPIIADYRQLEPVLARALARRSRRPFDLPGIGPVTARFTHVVVYGTLGGKIAVGLRFSAAAVGGIASNGTVWLTAKPENTINSRRVSFTQLSIVGVTDSVRTGLLLKVANAPWFSETIAGALTQNFSKDYDSLVAKIAHAVDEKRLGNLLIRAHITDVRTGQIKAAGRGVYLPVWGQGTASIVVDSRTASRIKGRRS